MADQEFTAHHSNSIQQTGRDSGSLYKQPSKRSIFENNLRFSNPASYRTLDYAGSQSIAEEDILDTQVASKNHHDEQQFQ